MVASETVVKVIMSYFFYTHTDQSLEEILAKCQAVLDSFQSMDDITWESRMENLNENWEASPSSIFEAILLSQNPSVELCDICNKAPCLLDVISAVGGGCALNVMPTFMKSIFFMTGRL